MYTLPVFVVLVAAAAFFGAQFMPGAWYFALAKPAWTPPSWLFAPVWTVLYVMIAVAGWLVWRKAGASRALIVWAIALVLNAAWSWWMFGEHRIGVALIDIVALWLAILAFIVDTWAQERRASLLFVPYLAWVSFAGALNIAIWRLNG